MCIISFKSWAALLPHFTDKDPEAQRSEVTCLRSLAINEGSVCDPNQSSSTSKSRILIMMWEQNLRTIKMFNNRNLLKELWCIGTPCHHLKCCKIDLLTREAIHNICWVRKAGSKIAHQIWYKHMCVCELCVCSSRGFTHWKVSRAVVPNFLCVLESLGEPIKITDGGTMKSDQTNGVRLSGGVSQLHYFYKASQVNL